MLRLLPDEISEIQALGDATMLAMQDCRLVDSMFREKRDLVASGVVAAMYNIEFSWHRFLHALEGQACVNMALCCNFLRRAMQSDAGAIGRAFGCHAAPFLWSIRRLVCRLWLQGEAGRLPMGWATMGVLPGGPGSV